MSFRCISFLCCCLLVTWVDAQSSCSCRVNGKCVSSNECTRVGTIVGGVIGGVLGFTCVMLALSYLIIGRVMKKKCCVCNYRNGKHGPIRTVYMISPDGCCKTHANQGDPCWSDADPGFTPTDSAWMANQASYNGQQSVVDGSIYSQSNPMPYRQAVASPPVTQHSTLPPPIQHESSLYGDPGPADGANKTSYPTLPAPVAPGYPPSYGYAPYPSAPQVSGPMYSGLPAGGYGDFGYAQAKPYINRQGSAGDPEPMGL